MKGIVLAGGSGTRLHPLTSVVSKQLLPVYDRPMVFYPVSLLMNLGIREILVISTPEHLPLFRKVLGDGSDFGIRFEYAEQPKPEGIAQALVIGENFIKDDRVALILGDNVFIGEADSMTSLRDAEQDFLKGAVIFAHQTAEAHRFGVIEISAAGEVLSIEEKPNEPKSDLAVTGLYFYDASCVKVAKGLKKSSRGEYEITDVNKAFLKNGEIKAYKFSGLWEDAGTFASLLTVSNAVQKIRQCPTDQFSEIGLLEKIAHRKGWI